jgi:hypothetical protein
MASTDAARHLGLTHPGSPQESLFQ